jgi:hypothetical protein
LPKYTTCYSDHLEADLRVFASIGIPFSEVEIVELAGLIERGTLNLGLLLDDVPLADVDLMRCDCDHLLVIVIAMGRITIDAREHRLDFEHADPALVEALKQRLAA